MIDALYDRMADFETRTDPEPIPQRAAPCGECHLKPGETCDICGAVEPADTWVRLGDAAAQVLETIRTEEKNDA